MIIDTHLHVVDRNRLRYPWLSGEPKLNHDFSYETYASEAKQCGITDTLFMEVDVHPDDIDAEIDFVKEKAKPADSLLRGIFAACRPEDDGFAAHLERYRDDGFVKGFRRLLHTVPGDPSASPKFRENIRRLSGTGMSFDLCVFPHQHRRAMELIDLAPDVQFVLDHCGVPNIKGNGLDPWRGTVTEIARRPNVVAKISGVMAYTDPENWTVETLRPYVEHTIGAFGWDRVVWGTDWPVCTLGGSLSTWLAATHTLISGASADEKTALFSGNARRLWKLA